MEPIRKRLGGQIRLIRKLRKMSQAQLAETAGISDNFVGLVERGERSPTLATVEHIANALNVDIEELFAFSVSKSDKEKLISELVYNLRRSKLKDVRVISQIAEDVTNYLKGVNR